jgi:hypothetical protein
MVMVAGWVKIENIVNIAIDRKKRLLYLLNSMNEELAELGQKLVENSLNAEEFSAQRGLINELFPYVYEASKRMSSRAMSRWLESKGMKLSPATIAKALRNPKPYWQELAEEIEPAATIVSNAFGLSVKSVLLDEAALHHIVSAPPAVDGATLEGARLSYDEIDEARHNVVEGWFKLPQSAREACLAYADLNLEDIEGPDDKAPEKETEK